ncbi:uncharacterized protein VDAG_09384 [Verticillium dahliae VdLs.17]|uniref:Cytochrome b5 heme-binding domain-containing protein n=1 Tax=Verticillium dahliae (strain VdLs.17 / ATCC MYA-4575 / FGSC 10137) TaxID=498257 RepID=G2XGV2_VERDV|nr:uncharacterized protein VDAG_09384 [Verticillium dahliae VdLs.17]EGY19050.1 hypothetical protein VDAG_09384 [Verticillium dahliae VdLs.17]
MPFGYRTVAASDSPWDREYGTATDKAFIPPGRSALDPAFPPMDPRTLHPLSADHQNVLDIHHPSPMDKPSPPELDALFYSESSQMMDFHGLRTFEAAALHNPAWSQNRLEEVSVSVKESSWLNVFKKIRWCSFERPIIETSPGLAAAGFGMADDWSVDNPAVWGPLSTSIELANRIILQSFKTPWMQALLTPENWVTELRDVQDARRQFPVIPNAPVPVFFPDPNRPDKTEEQCKQYVQGLFATQKPLWHLHADTDDRSRVWMGFASTNTRPDLISDSGYGYHVNHLAAFVDVDPLRTMLNPNATSHSRYIARAMLAITISHELMYFNGERMAELGHSFIQNFFGNAVENVPLRLGKYMALRGPMAGSGPFFNAYSTFFPESHISMNGYTAFVHVVPDLPADPLAYRKDTRWDVAAANLMTANFQNDMQTARADLSLVRHAVATWRPWHHRAHAQWAATVYSHEQFRGQLHEMVDCFRSPIAGIAGPLKEHKAASFVARVTSPWFREYVASWQAYPQPHWLGYFPDFETMHHCKRAKAFFYQSMALLVDAALAPRDQEIKFQDPPLPPAPPRTWRRSGNKPNPVGYDPIAYHEQPAPEQYTIEPRHQPYNQFTSEIRVRARNVELAYRCYCMYRWFVLTTQPLDTAFFAQLNSHRAQLVALQQHQITHPHAPQPLIPFTFQLPPYTETAQFRAENFNVLAMTKMLELNPLRAVQHLFQPGQDIFQEWLQLPQDTVMHPFQAQLARTVETRGCEYLTLGRLYDLRVRKDNVLVLVLFDSEIEIFELEDVMQVLKMTAEEVRDEMEPSAYGHVLKKNVSDEFYDTEHDILPLGRVAQWLREEDVAIRNGKEGRPHWITAAGGVYDLTDLEEPASESQSKLVETLLSAPGSNPMPRVFLGDHNFDDALALIEPLKIGMTLPFGLADESGSKNVLTNHEIGWNQFPQTRQYIQIHEHAYDITGMLYYTFSSTRVIRADENLTDYAEWHPGGSEILARAAGTDATNLFEEYHSENGEDLLEAIQGLRIGRIVPSRTRYEKLSTTEIRIQDTIFDIAPLRETEAELFVALKHYCGKDVSKKVLAIKPSTEPSKTHPLLLMSNSKPELIVTKITRGMEDLPLMSEAELVMHDGGLYHGHDGYAASYVAYDGAVFDVTTLMQYGPRPFTDVLGKFLGNLILSGAREIRLGQLLQQRFPFRIVARLAKFDEPLESLASEVVRWQEQRDWPATYNELKNYLLREDETQQVSSPADKKRKEMSQQMKSPYNAPEHNIVQENPKPEQEKRLPEEPSSISSGRAMNLQKLAPVALKKLQKQLMTIRGSRAKTKRVQEEAVRSGSRRKKRPFESESWVRHEPVKRVRVA